MSGTRQVPVAEGLFTWPSDEPRLIGAQCAGCGLTGFPAGPACQRCGGAEFTEKLLPGPSTPRLPASGLPVPAAPKPEPEAARTPTPIQPAQPVAQPAGGTGPTRRGVGWTKRDAEHGNGRNGNN